MNGAALVDRLAAILAGLEANAGEFRRVDAAIGDGDLGVTVQAACHALNAALPRLPADSEVADVMRQAAESIAEANPSTLGTLISIGLRRAASTVGPDPVDTAGAVRVLTAVRDAIADKGGAERGDKTILDAVDPSIQALTSPSDPKNPHAPLDAAISAAREGIEKTKDLVGRRGRSAWVGQRGVGHLDAGAVLYLRFLEYWKASADASGRPHA